jgi:hypothetical protein
VHSALGSLGVLISSGAPHPDFLSEQARNVQLGLECGLVSRSVTMQHPSCSPWVVRQRFTSCSTLLVYLYTFYRMEWYLHNISYTFYRMEWYLYTVVEWKQIQNEGRT